MLFVFILCSHWLNVSHDDHVAGSYNFIASLGKLMASQQVFIAISRICIIGLCLLDVLPIGTTTTKTNLLLLLYL